ncbi:hypothetical protein PGT21_026076 [Puccinia graminis f. sp. tritici]|uniref:Uncharacterized protein n=1 Tax=Puccinia graminis f. sp. tritici TaxID=56615 RepID=A0A5B0NEN8_PUCGR|nr:hypothetical protein PGT21_026076 [Puccinia graminis f. sp. tritici]
MSVQKLQHVPNWRQVIWIESMIQQISINQIWFNSNQGQILDLQRKGSIGQIRINMKMRNWNQEKHTWNILNLKQCQRNCIILANFIMN